MEHFRSAGAAGGGGKGGKGRTPPLERGAPRDCCAALDKVNKKVYFQRTLTLQRLAVMSYSNTAAHGYDFSGSEERHSTHAARNARQRRAISLRRNSPISPRLRKRKFINVSSSSQAGRSRGTGANTTKPSWTRRAASSDLACPSARPLNPSTEQMIYFFGSSILNKVCTRARGCCSVVQESSEQ